MGGIRGEGVYAMITGNGGKGGRGGAEEAMVAWDEAQ